MSFEEVRTDEEKEYIDEIITTTHQTKKVWSKAIMEKEIVELAAKIAEMQERKAVLEEQFKSFTIEKVTE